MTPEQRREQAENGVVMEEKTDVPKLADVLDDARVKVCIGLEQQGHIPTVERMLAEGKTWEEIGEVIGWYGPTAEEWYGLYLKAREGSQAPPADALSLAADGLAEAAKLALEYVADPSKNPFAVASRCETESEGVPMSEKKEQSAETEMYICEISHLILHPNQPYIFRVHPDCKGCKDYLGVEQPAASPAQLSARELAYSFACSLVDEGLIRAADCPEVTERLEAYRDASQRQPSELQSRLEAAEETVKSRNNSQHILFQRAMDDPTPEKIAAWFGAYDGSEPIWQTVHNHFGGDIAGEWSRRLSERQPPVSEEEYEPLRCSDVDDNQRRG